MPVSNEACRYQRSFGEREARSQFIAAAEQEDRTAGKLTSKRWFRTARENFQTVVVSRESANKPVKRKKDMQWDGLVREIGTRVGWRTKRLTEKKPKPESVEQCPKNTSLRVCSTLVRPERSDGQPRNRRKSGARRNVRSFS